MPHFDAIVIGSGQAGPSLTGRLTGVGKTVAFIEREHFGGTCVNDGCIPTKALVASAQTAHVARRAADFGVTISGAIDVDMKAVKARKDMIVARSRTNVEKWVRGMKGCTVYLGQARFTGTGSHGYQKTGLSPIQGFFNLPYGLFLVVSKPQVIHGLLGQPDLSSENILFEQGCQIFGGIPALQRARMIGCLTAVQKPDARLFFELLQIRPGVG